MAGDGSQKLPERRQLPYQCSLCGAKFDAIPSLEQHMSVHNNDYDNINGNNSNDNSSAEDRRPPKRPRLHRPRTAPRAMQACRACAASKTKCDNERHCKRCWKKKIPCVRPFDPDQHAPYSQTGAPGSHGGSTRSMGTPPHHESLSPNHHHDQVQNGADEVVQVLGVIMNAENGKRSTDRLSSPERSSQQTQQHPIPTVEMQPGISHAEWDLNLLQDHFNFGTQDGDLDFFSTSFPDIFSPDGGYAGDQTALTPMSISPVVDDCKSFLVTEAFQNATGRWAPAACNFQAEVEKNLSAAHGTDITTDSVSPWDYQMMSDGFPLGARDRLLAMLVGACDAGNVARVGASFPSCEGLGQLVRSFLAWHANQEDTWIHVPTFSVAEVKVELLAAIVASGAVRSPSRAVQKFGLAVLEIVILQLRDEFHKSNVLTRELPYLQAYALQMSLGLWSGDKRQMEIAGGSVGNLLNMLRGGGRYRRFSRSTIIACSDDCGEALESKWRQWVEQESFTRLVYHMYIHCSQEALMTAVASPLSHIELLLPFPQSRQLWLAQSASSWKKLSLELQSQERHSHVSMVDCLVDISRLREVPISYDANIARLAVLYGISAMVHNCRQLNIAYMNCCDGPAGRKSVFADEGGQYRWLLRVFSTLHQTFKLYEASAKPPVAILLVLELLLLHFHASIDQMELLAGKEGLLEAQVSYNILGKWVETAEARQSVWHAGQILRLIRTVPPETMTDFHCVAVYHVSLCLWTFGTIMNKKSGDTLSATPAATYHESAQGHGQDILLDGEETLESQRWIAFNKGYAVISNPGHEGRGDARPVLSVRATDALMQACIQTIRSKYPSRIVLPPATEVFCNLMHTLGTTAQRETDAPK